jgi:hypothetical protein
MATQAIKKINAYRLTNADINNAIAFINSGYVLFPAGMNARQRLRFNEKFGFGTGFVTAGLPWQLRYNPNPHINIPVARPQNIQGILLNLYNQDHVGLGKGLQSFYKTISMRYLNIPKKDTDRFLRSQGDYTIAKVPRKPNMNAPIVTSVPNERWGIDLIDMNAYHSVPNLGRRWIMTIVDYFSGKVWARALPNKSNGIGGAATLSNAINDICTNDAHTFPHIIQCDNEFNAGAFLVWANNNGVILIPVSAYTPNSNGKVERMNREIRKKIKAGLIRNNDYVWAPRLQSYVDNINNSVNSTSKLTPNQLWTQGYNPHPANHIVPMGIQLNDNMNIAQRQLYQEANILRRAHAATTPVPNFQVGDLVRVKMLSVSTELRRIKENHIGWNRNVVHYTPEVFRIHAVYPYPGRPRNTQYSIETTGIPPVVVLNNRYNFANALAPANFGNAPKLFFYDELTRVPVINQATNVNPPTRHRALQLARYVA